MKGIITACAADIVCIMASFICPPFILFLLCFEGVQTVSDELTSRVYSFMSWAAGITAFVIYALNGTFRWDFFVLLIISILLFVIISLVGAFADGDVECTVPYLIAMAALNSNPLEKALIVLIVSSGTMTLEYILRKLITKKVPENLPFMKNLFLGMVVASVF